MHIAPAPRTFASELGKGVSRGLSGAADLGIQTYLEKQKEKKELEKQKKALEAENEYYLKRGLDLRGLTNPEIRKLEIASQLRSEKTTQQEEKEDLSSHVQELEDLIPYTGSQLIPGPGFEPGELLPLPSAIRENLKFNREAVQKRETFDQLGFWLTDKVYTHFNKGTVSNKKFEAIMNDLAPNSRLSERTNKARIAALKKLLNLPSTTPQKTFEKIAEHEMDKVKKLEQKEGVKSQSSIESFWE